jgi:exopolysaccharide production protein ExoY
LDGQAYLEKGTALSFSVKRAIDIVGAVCALILFSLPMVGIAILLKLSSPGPILFRQKRIGQNGVPFGIVKFRTMRVDAEGLLLSDRELYRKYIDNGFKLPEGEDPRITPVGSFLRKTSLDELPQIFNVIAGTMSLVGPRPVVPSELSHYGNRQAIFLSAKPGMTGYWQISGRSSVGYPERVELELYYVYNWSLWLDMKILLLTVPSVVMHRGAH